MSGTQLDSRTRTTISLERAQFETFITPELRAYMSQYSDPLVLNFKLMIDFSKPYGLFADETYLDSALAYLKRIGETIRYEALKNWISIFKIFVKNYDFLILNCDGLDNIVNQKPWENFSEEDKVSFSIRETSDMMVQSLLTTYRQIWFDYARQVEVLPANLRRFDLAILVYSAGYFNMSIYDSYINNKQRNEPITKMYPTLKKLSDEYFIENADSYDFNHHLIMIIDAQINNEDSGKSFFESINNEPNDEYRKNTLALNFRFATYTGTFNNIFGEFDIVKELALAASQEKFNNESSKSVDFSEKMKKYWEEAGESFKDNSTRVIRSLTSKPTTYLKSLFSVTTPIGNLISQYADPTKLANMAKNAIDEKIQEVENKYIYDNIAKLQNMVMSSFSDSFLDIYKNELEQNSNKKQIETLENPTKTDKNTGDVFNVKSAPTRVGKGITYQKSNIYNRKGF
jgi:hypothetical protein